MEQQVLDLLREGIFVIIKTSMPMLLSALIIGLVVSIFQAVTSIQEQTLAFVPKIIAVFLSIVIFGSWILQTLVGFIAKIFSSFSSLL